jgi:uncharacterized integral membrane protein
VVVVRLKQSATKGRFMSEQTPAKKTELNWSLIAKLLVVAMLIVLLAINADPTQLNLGVVKVKWPLWVELVIAFVLGAFFGRDVWNWIASKFRKPKA